MTNVTPAWLAERARHVAEKIRRDRQTGWFQRSQDWDDFADEISHPTTEVSADEIYGS